VSRVTCAKCLRFPPWRTVCNLSFCLCSLMQKVMHVFMSVMHWPFCPDFISCCYQHVFSLSWGYSLTATLFRHKIDCKAETEEIWPQLCLLVHNAAVGRAPAYITDLHVLQPATTTSSRSAVLLASRGSWSIGLSCHGQIEDSQIERSPLLQHERGRWNQLQTYLKTILLSQRGRAMLRVCQ